ncbi:NAD(P)/FAD-dependent oxidoreductase [Vulcanisaeta thermophila]|uniref:NAD(P)/FAD-dependent oxidoreductase n=1 Tax=Vulcanisaeta thermophila TaxID=867917 RepID=UPI00085318F4|nr:NAD(P)/FAD-dependent oxidoreductase [Vulcanisaeta thermophila]
MSSGFVIIGAGPSGLYLARELGRFLDNVIIFEEDRELGLPPHCTGLVNINSISALGIAPPIVNTYRYVRITDLEGNSVTFDFMGNSIAMLDRPGLENYLAEGINASLILGERVLEVKPSGLVTRNHRNVDYSIAVIAEGAVGSLSGKLIPWRQRYVYGVQSDVRSFRSNGLMPRSLDEIVVIFDRRLSNHFFAWIVPRDSHEYRIGVADDIDVWTKFTALMRMVDAGGGKYFGGKVIIGGSPDHVVTGRVALIGDAAGFVKPMTGGGIVMGMVSARLLADSIINALNNGLTAENGLAIYDSVFRRLIRGKITALSAASHILHEVMGTELNAALKSLSGVRVRVSDYDNHVGAVVKAALVSPGRFLRALSFIMGGVLSQGINDILSMIKNLV